MVRSTKKAPTVPADRKNAFNKGLRKLKESSPAVVGRIVPELYDRSGHVKPDQIIPGDCLELLNSAKPGWADLCFADPPFNIGYLYNGYEDEKPAEQYVHWSTDWMKAVHRALKPDGSFYLAIGDEYAAELCVAAKSIGFNLRNWIVWHYTFGQQPKQKFARSHTHILYFVKDEKNFTFNADAIRVPSARQLIYNDKRAVKKGKIPDDTWYLRPQEAQGDLFNADDDVWFESRLCGTFKEREGWHGCQMPLAVLERIIKVSSGPNDIVLDPFNGSGTTVVASALLGRKYVGLEQNEEYVDFARRRLAAALEEHGEGSDSIDISKAAPMNRASKIETETDALGRKRVARRKAKAAG
ncbi:MAG: site-specific DNA-methyltransferase, partial [Planctomycetota bacterium]